MARFSPGDRVQYADADLGTSWHKAEAVVEAVEPDGSIIYVRFVNPVHERGQIYDAGWPPDCFELAEDRGHELINEDWS